LHGAILLVTPCPQKTLGEVLIGAIADWAKVMVGIAIPLFTLAAAIEAWVTPVLLSAAFQ
jgi:uncharacterized membrane protein SpoIIM required for sporulation